MGWFSDAFDFFDSGGGGWLGPAIGGATMIGGALLAGDANKDAARIGAEASDRALAAQRQSAGEANETLQQLSDEYGPARDLLIQRAMRDPSSLTPGQQKMLEDLARSSEAATAASGLRGAGRTRLALMDDLLGRAQGRFYDINRSSSEEAAGSLADMGIRGITSQAAVKSGLGNATSNTLMRGADIAAGAKTATGSVWGETLGSLGGLISESIKDRDRKRRFEDGIYRMPVPV